MSILKFKNPDGTWESIAAIKGEPGRDGAIQYQAGEGIKIEDNVISSENSGSNNMGVVYIVTSQNLNSDENFAPTLRTDLNNALTDYFANNNNENPVLIIKGTSNSETHVFVPTSASSFISIAGNLSAGYIERRISCTFQYIDGVKNVKSVNYYFKRRNILFKDNTDSFTPTSNYHPATKKYVDDVVANVGGDSFPNSVYFLDTATTILLNGDTQYITSSNVKDKMGEILTDSIVKKGIKPTIAIKGIGDSARLFLFTFANYNTGSKKMDFYCTWSEFNESPKKIYNLKLVITCSVYTDTQITVSGMLIEVQKTELLTMNTTTTFTPTSDYNIANKKYVDDQIKASITTVLEADY